MNKLGFPKTSPATETGHEKQSVDALILQSFAKLDKVALGISFGSTLGLVVFVATVTLLYKGGSPLGPNLSLLALYFVGYSVSWLGSFIGLGYGFLSGFILGWSYAFVRNLLVVAYLNVLKLKNHLRTLQDFLDQP